MGFFMMDIIPFNFDGADVRVIDQDNKLWFVLNDVCNVLQINNSRQAASYLDDDEKGVINSDTLGGVQKATIINESGLYSLILRSRKPEAKRFKKWVTSEVLPSIRKTGGYMMMSPQQFGGISKSVINKAINPIVDRMNDLERQIIHALSGLDPEVSVTTQYKPMIAVLIEKGIPQKGRRSFSCKCSNLCRRFGLKNNRDGMVRISRETNRYLFHVDLIDEWMNCQGYRIISEHMDKIAGQSQLRLIKTP